MAVTWGRGYRLAVQALLLVSLWYYSLVEDMVKNFLYFYTIYRLKELRAENDQLEGRAAAAERSAASFEAQRKTAVAEKTKFQKRVWR